MDKKKMWGIYGYLEGETVRLLRGASEECQWEKRQLAGSPRHGLAVFFTIDSSPCLSHHNHCLTCGRHICTILTAQHNTLFPHVLATLVGFLLPSASFVLL